MTVIGDKYIYKYTYIYAEDIAAAAAAGAWPVTWNAY